MSLFDSAVERLDEREPRVVGERLLDDAAQMGPEAAALVGEAVAAWRSMAPDELAALADKL